MVKAAHPQSTRTQRVIDQIPFIGPYFKGQRPAGVSFHDVNNSFFDWNTTATGSRENSINYEKLVRRLTRLEESIGAGDINSLKDFFTLNNGNPNSEAFQFIKTLMQSDDQTLREKATTIFFKFLPKSKVFQGISKSNPADSKSTKTRDKVLKAALQFIQSESPEQKRQASINMADAVGYIYRGDGDDRKNLTVTADDKRLIGFYSELQKSPETALLYDLLQRSGFLESQTAIFEEYVQGNSKIGLHNTIQQSINEQHLSRNPDLGKIDKKAQMTADKKNTEEIEFLNRFGYGDDFKFTISEFETSMFDSSTTREGNSRSHAIKKLLVANGILSLRKAQSSSKKEKGRIETQQQNIFDALHRAAGNDDNIRELIQEVAGSKLGFVFLMQSSISYQAANEATKGAAKEVCAEVDQFYEATALIDDGHGGVRKVQSYDDLMKLQTRSKTIVAQRVTRIAKEVSSLTIGMKILDEGKIKAFESIISSYTPNAKKAGKALNTDDVAWNDTLKGLDPNAQDFFFESSVQDLKIQLLQSKDPAAKYVMRNFKLIYGTDFDTFFDNFVTEIKSSAATDRAQNHKSLVTKFQDYILSSKNRLTNGGNIAPDFGRRIIDARFDTAIQRLIDTPQNELKAEERLIQDVLEKLTQADRDSGFDRSIIIKDLLLAPEVDSQLTIDGINLQAAKRLTGLSILEQLILVHPGYDKSEREAALSYLYKDGLSYSDASEFQVKKIPNRGFSNATSFRQVALSHKNIAKSLRKNFDYSNVISANLSGASAVVKHLYLQADLESDTQDLSLKVSQEIMRESKHLLKGLYGEERAAALEDVIHGEDFTSNFANLASSAYKVLKEGKIEDPEVLAEFVRQLTEFAGVDMQTMSSTNIFTGQDFLDNFIFQDHPAFTSNNKSEFFEMIYEIWQSLLATIRGETSDRISYSSKR